jgi:hypothetical protein
MASRTVATVPRDISAFIASAIPLVNLQKKKIISHHSAE